MGWRGHVGISVVGVSLLLTAGCSADAASSGFPDSGVYLSTAESTFPLVAGTSVRMELTEGRLSATAGCNTLSGNYSLKGQTLSVPVLASTRIGCPDELAAQDQRLEQLLTSAPTVAVDPLGFTLTGADATTLVMTQSSASPAVT